MISSTQNAVSFNDLLKLYSLLDNKYETKTGETAFIMSKKIDEPGFGTIEASINFKEQ
jgi:hypothetical protein